MPSGREYWQVDDHEPPEDPLERLYLFSHAPMPPRLRNEVITDYYRRWARRIHDDIGAWGVPNWFAWAAWVSSSLPREMERRRPGRPRLVRALAAGNVSVFYDVMVEFMASYEAGEETENGAGRRSGNEEGRAADRAQPAAEPTGGRAAEGSAIPVAAGPGAGPAAGMRTTRATHETPEAEARLARLTEGIACYRDAARATDLERKKELILLGNCNLVLAEQTFLNDEVAVAMRVMFRRLTTPPWQWHHSQRIWRELRPCGLRLRLENRYVHFATKKVLSLRTPFAGGSVHPGNPPEHGNAPRPPLRPGSLISHPFDEFPPQRSAACWVDLADRLGFINWLFSAYGDDPSWRTDDGLALPREWADHERLWKRLVDRYLSGRSEGRAETRLPTGYAASLADFDAARNRPADDGAPSHAESLPVLQARMTQLARAMYKRERTWIALAFLARSLPEAFAAGKGAATLAPASVGVLIDGVDPDHRPSTLRSDAAWRARRTLDFIDSMFGFRRTTDDADAANLYDGSRDPVGSVRERHRRVRARLLDPDGSGGEWNPDLGQPINQEDMLGTVCTFVEPVRSMFDANLPGRVKQEEWDAWTATWCAIGCSLGLDPKFVTVRDGADVRYLTAIELAKVAGVIRGRQQERSLGGVQLMANLVEDLRDAVPQPLAAFVLPSIVAFGDREVNRILMVPPSALGESMRRAFCGAARRRSLRRLMPVLVEPFAGWAIGSLERVTWQRYPDLTTTFPASCCTA